MAKSKAGRPLFEITEAVCKKAESLAAQGLTQLQIASVLGMGQSTLYEKLKAYPEFLEAITVGKAKGITQVTNALFKKAVDGDVSAQKYYLNNRDNGNWKDRIDNTHSGPDGGPIQTDHIFEFIPVGSNGSSKED
jgi:transcriptional regulator with XRE-family HTH domain